MTVAEHARLLRAIHARARGRQAPKRKKLPRQQEPNALRVEYFKLLKKSVLEPMRELIAAVVEHRSDSRFDTLPKFHGLAQHILNLFPNAKLANLTLPIASKVSDFQRRQLSRQLASAVGVELPINSPKEKQKIASWVEENVSLIRSIPMDYLSQVEKVVRNGIREGVRAEDLQQDIADRFEVSESRAKLIARDQIGKLYGELNQDRQESLGVEGYFWRGMLDNRERPEHFDREGEQFSWSDPPEDGHPGEPINCRCYAEPDFTPILEDL